MIDPARLILLVVLALYAAPALGQPAEPDVHGTFDGDPMYSLLPLDAIPAIHDPEFVTGADADRQMQDDEPVLGLEIDGDPRAYSLWQLDTHEIVNDTVGGRAIAATW
jgi:hypothetical protein